MNCSIAFISDETYIMPTCIAIQSIIENCSKLIQYNVFVFTNSCQEHSKQLIKNLENDNIKIKVIDLSTDKYDCYFKESLSATPTALCKFDLAHLLPNINKILYLDCDILIQDDLYPLYNIDLGDNYAAVVKDMQLVECHNPQNAYLKIHHKYYFNSGVMLLNLSKLREDNLQQALIHYKKYGINKFMDQDAFNVIFGEKVIYLDLKYNVIYRMIENYPLEEVCNFYSIPICNNREEIYKQAVILHLASPCKPWNNYTQFLSDRFLFYYNKSPYKNIPLKLGPIVPNRLKNGKRSSDLPIEENKKSLFVCSSISSIFNAVIIKSLVPFLVDHSCDIVILGEPSCIKNIEYIKNLGIFDKYYIIPSHYSDDFFHLNDLEKQNYFKEIRSSSLFNYNIYSDVFYSNANTFLRLIYYHQIENGKGARIHIFDENINSYIRNYQLLEERESYNIFNESNNSFSKNIVDYYLYKKNLVSFKHNIPVISIPDIKLNKAKLKKYLDIYDSKINDLEYIFITYENNNFFDEEIKLLEIMKNFLGTDNLYIRANYSQKEIYKQKGFRVIEDHIPLESYLLENDIKAVFSLFSIYTYTNSVITKNNIPLIFLYNIINNKLISNELSCSKLNMINDKFEKIYIPIKISDFHDILIYLKISGEEK